MTERTAKKLGEVLAFAEVGLETLERGSEAFEKLLNAKTLAERKEENINHARVIRDLALSAEVSSTVEEKAKATGAKLVAMRDLYIKDAWDNATELLEWSGFFEGAAIVHWSLVCGALRASHESPHITSFLPTAEEALVFHTLLFEQAKESLSTVGLTYEAN